MASKKEIYDRLADEALRTAASRLKGLAGVISIHAQDAFPKVSVVVLVDSDEARDRVYEAEQQLFEEDPYLTIDLHVYDVPVGELEDEHRALAMAHSLVWCRT